MQPERRPLVPRLPGTSASRASGRMVIFFGVLVLVGFVPITLLEASWSGERGGHLPWPAVQWAVTTPAGALVLITLSLLVVGPIFVLRSITQRMRELARAVDITDLPPQTWPGPRRSLPRRPSLQGWLGHGRGDQAVNTLLLALGVALAVMLMGMFIASGIYAFAAHGAVQCGDGGIACPPAFSLTENGPESPSA